MASGIGIFYGIDFAAYHGSEKAVNFSPLRLSCLFSEVGTKQLWPTILPMNSDLG